MKKTAVTTLLPLLVGLFCAGGLVAGCTDDDPDDSLQQNDDANEDDAGFDDTGDADGPDAGADVDDDADRPSTDSGEEWDWEDEDFHIETVIPARGPVSGGTEVHVDGAELTDGTELWFGNQRVEAEISQGQLVAETPPAPGSGPVTVRAVSTGGEESEILNGFTYADPVQIDDVSPDVLPTTGGIEIDVHGSGFVEPMGVTFEGISARRIEVVNSNLARVVTPRMPSGDADLRMSVPDEQLVVDDAVHFFAPLEVEVIEPAAGSTAGSEQVVLRGQGFDADTRVEFGGQPADVQSVDVSAGELVVTTPPASAPGPVDVRVESEYDIELITDGFWYDEGEDDAIYSIQPDTAAVSGGSEHVVSGYNLDAIDAEFFVGSESVQVLEEDERYVRIIAPEAPSPGSVDVVFERGSTERDRIDDGLTYLSDFAVDAVTPESGSTDGGDEVTITGQGLDGVDRVSFGGVSAVYEIVDDTELKITTPAGEPGAVDVVVSTPHDQVVVDNGFFYEGDLEVWSLHPSRGSIAGNTYVTVNGTGFFGTIGVEVGGIPAEDIRRIDPYTVAFRTPPGSSTGSHPVDVAAMGQQAESPYPFVYFNPTSSFGGAHGPPIDGAINVSVLNMDGTPLENAFVMLSTDPDTPYRGLTDEHGRVTISGPDLMGPQTITATAAERSTATVRELNARNVTFLLNPLEPEQGDPGEIPPPPMAHFEGTISVTGKGTDPMGGGIEINMSQVRTTRNALLRPTLAPGQDATVAGEGDYELRSRVGDLALIGLCGYYDSETEEFTPKFMAVERGFAVSDGQQTEVDLECDIRLDDSVPIRLTDPVWAPAGPNYNEVTTFLDFGYEGVFRMPDVDRGLDDVIYAQPLPRLEDELENVSFTAIAGSYTDGSLPYTQTTLRDIDDLDRLWSTAPLVGIPDLLEPAAGQVVGDYFRMGRTGSNTPDFQYVLIRNPMGLPVWTFMLPGDDEIVPLPEFPEFAALPADQRPQPYQPGDLFTHIYGVNIDGFDYHGFTYGDYQSTRWSAFSVDSFDLRLAE